MRKIQIPYTPRKLQKEIHNNLKRFNVLVCHRRFGKTVLAVNELIKTALTCPLPRPRCFYIAPTYSSAKRIAWDFLKHYTSVIPNMDYHETELRADFPNGARIQLLGCERPNSLRGIYIDECILDEYQNFPPNMFSEIIRPATSDRKGRVIFQGTPNGFASPLFEMYQISQQEEEWFGKIFKASETGIIDDDELAEAKRIMPPETFEAEYECSFDAQAIGSIYSASLQKCDEEGRVTKIPYDSKYKVSTFWDLGMQDKTAIWFVQQVGTSIHLIDYFEDSGESLNYYASVLQDKGYLYDVHNFPHDAKVRELGTGKSRFEVAQSLGMPVSIVPKLSIQDGINQVRMTLGRCWFDFEKTKQGLDALRQYRWATNDKGENKNRPEHNWTSHSADSFRYLCVGLNESKQWSSKIEYPKLAIV